jgi:4-hydroxy-tetrahydrodipicolinate reductase
MRIALIGVGKMGQQIHELLKKEEHVDVVLMGKNRPENWRQMLKTCDVAIEFTRPDQVVQNLEDCFELGVPVVTGTTGWEAQKEAVLAKCEAAQGTLFYAANFSLGVHLFDKLVQWFSNVMSSYPDYEADLEETHHVHKKDAPSGTAIRIAESFIKNNLNYTSWSLKGQEGSGVLPVFAHRKDEVVGTHTLRFFSPYDEIKLTHHAFNRSGFAAGAIEAAKFVVNKKGIFTMNDLIPV